MDCLVALVSECSVTKAADLAGISQPRMSNALARLRKLFGDPLLVRAGQRMVPTERALEVARQVRDGLGQIDLALESPKDFDPATSDRSFVAVMSDYVAGLTLPPLMGVLGRSAPAVTVSTKMFDATATRRWLEEGECDIAFGFFMNLGESLKASVLFHDEVIAVARTGNPLVQGVLDMETFLAARHAISASLPSPTSTIEQLCDVVLHGMGQERNVAVRVPSPYSVSQIVASTDLLAILPARLAAQYAQVMPLQQLPLPFRIEPFSITMVWQERCHNDPAHHWLRRQFRAIGKQLG